jgi:hypothetical protein
MEKSKQPLLRTVMGMMLSPAGALKGALAGRWYVSAAVSALAFGLFFLQTGLDLYKTGQKDFLFAVLFAGLGFLYGAVIIPLLGSLFWSITKMAKTQMSLNQAVSVFCLCYSGALIYGLFGLVFSLALGWNTAITFGVTGVLWATGPMIHTIRRMTEGKTALSVFLSTVAGLTILLSWSLFSRI